ncbi:MAG: hypothetical protein ACREEE_14835, partial [Dongiaceae bacterium]
GIAEAVRLQMNEHPEAMTVHLSSPGGLVVEGRQLRDLIFSRGLDTYVRTFCVSACTLAFIGGRQRVVYRNAIIGFHQYGGFPGESLRDNWQDVDRRYFRGRGVADDFVDQMFRAQHEALWQLTAGEAVAAKVASRTTDRFDAPPAGFYPAQAWRALESGKGQYAQLYATLRRYEPDAHREAVTMALDSMLSDESPESIAQAGLLAGSIAYLRLLPTTSDQAAHAVTGAFATMFADLRSSSPEVCAAILTAESGIVLGEDDIRRYQPATMARLAGVYAAVIRDAHERPLPKLSDGAVERAREAFAELLVESDVAGDLEFLHDTQAYRRQPDRACGLFARLYALLAKEPAERGGPYFKALMAE